jgi:hypothetical protein
MSAADLPELVAFEGRVYRLDRLAAVREGDVEVERADKPLPWAFVEALLRRQQELAAAHRHRVASDGRCVVCGADGVTGDDPCPPPGTMILREGSPGSGRYG